MPTRPTAPPPNRLEIFTLGHLGLFLAGATWMLGGSPPWAKQLLSSWGSLGLALMVDVLAAGLGASHFSFEASSFGDCEGGPPRTGQFVLAIEPTVFAGPDFLTRIESLFAATTTEPGVRLPGERRLAARKAHEAGVAVRPDLIDLLETYAREGSPARRS